MNRRAGVLFFRIDGRQYEARGNFTYNLGQPKREPMIGPDGLHGWKETPQASRIEGEITDASDIALERLLNLVDATLTLELANGKTVVQREAFYSGDGDVGTEEANVQVSFHGPPAEEIGGTAP